MNNNTTFSTSTINEDYMLFPYSSQPLLPFSPSSSSINDLLIQSTSNTPNNHHQFLQPPSPFSLFDFSSDFSFLPQNNDHDNILPLNNPIEEPQVVEPSETITHIEDSQRISTSQDPRKMKKAKKRSRTDRHSKIKTAKGTRDRRIRLSQDVARELFGLQDMLGFDKASKSVEWLLIQAKPEIVKIAKNLPYHCALSSGDESHTRPAMDTSPDLSELASMWTVDDGGSNINMTEMSGNKVDGRSMRVKRKRSEPRMPILKKLSKDERAKARERAKDRTNEKMMKRISQVNVVEENAHRSNNGYVNSNGSSFEATPYKEENEELCKRDRFAVCDEFGMYNKYHISNPSFEAINKFNPAFSLLNDHHSQGAATSIEPQHHQFSDIHQFLGRPRDLMYNYHNLR